MTTLAEITLMVAECLIAPRYGVAEAGSDATHIVDSKLDEPDTLFDGGTIWFLTGLSAGRFARITSWDLPTGTFTFPTPGTVCAAGDQYAVIDARYPLDQLIASINAALLELGPFDVESTSSLTVVADQVIYSLASTGIAGVKRVQFATSDTEPYNWTSPYRWWKEIATDLVLSEYHLPGPAYTGNKIRIFYEQAPTRLGSQYWAQAITRDVHPQRIAWLAAWYSARWRNARGDTTDAVTRGAEEVAKAQAFAMQLKHPVRRMEKDICWSDLP